MATRFAGEVPPGPRRALEARVGCGQWEAITLSITGTGFGQNDVGPAMSRGEYFDEILVITPNVTRYRIKGRAVALTPPKHAPTLRFANAAG